jgi:hypothetical protein
VLRAGARPGRAAVQEVRATSMMTAALLGLADWLAALGVTRVAMEATGARPAEQVGAAGRLAVADG